MSKSGYPEGKGHRMDKRDGGVESCEAQLGGHSRRSMR